MAILETRSLLAMEALETLFCRSMRISSSLPSSVDLPSAPLGRPNRLPLVRFEMRPLSTSAKVREL